MKPIFRNAMLGFHKQDVFDFITRQNKQYESKLSEINSEKDRQIASLERELEVCREEMERSAELRGEADRCKELFAQVKSAAGQILADKDQLLLDLNALQEEQKFIKEAFAALSVRAAEAEKLREKAVKFDQLSGVLSTIFHAKEAVADSTEISDDVTDQQTCPDYSERISALLAQLSVLSVHCEKLRIALESNENNG